MSGGLNGELVVDVSRSYSLRGVVTDLLLFLFGADWATQGEGAILDDDFYVLRIGRKRFVGDDCLADVGRGRSIGLSVGLIVGGGRLRLILFGVVGR